MDETDRRVGRFLWGAQVIVCALSAACALSSRAPGWRQDQELLIGAAVLLDVAQGTEVLQRDLAPDVCLAVGKDIEAPPQEPDQRLVAMVRKKLPAVYPVSECRVTAEGVTRVSSGTKAVLLGVSSPEWQRDDFVQVKAWRFVNAFNAVSWTYTLDRKGQAWRIGVVKSGKIALRNFERCLEPGDQRGVFPVGSGSGVGFVHVDERFRATRADKAEGGWSLAADRASEREALAGLSAAAL